MYEWMNGMKMLYKWRVSPIPLAMLFLILTPHYRLWIYRWFITNKQQLIYLHQATTRTNTQFYILQLLETFKTTKVRYISEYVMHLFSVTDKSYFNTMYKPNKFIFILVL